MKKRITSIALSIVTRLSMTAAVRAENEYIPLRRKFEKKGCTVTWTADKPLILAGFSQGSDMVMRLMKDLFDEKDYSAAVNKEIPNLTGAYIDETRGTLKVLDINPSDYSNSLFEDGVYHLYDYQFFYRNLQENVKTRLNEFHK